MATVLAEYQSSLTLPPSDSAISSLWMSSPSPDPISTAYINSMSTAGHLSPPAYHHQISGSSDNLTIDVMGTPPPHQASPHSCFSTEATTDGCPPGLMYTADFNTGCEMISQYSTGERSPTDSGSEFPSRQSVIRNKVYSPTCHSPPTSEFDTLTMAEPLPPCSQLLDSNTDYLAANGLLHYSHAVPHTPPPMYQPSYTQSTGTMMTCDVPCPPIFARNHPYVDGGSPPMLDGPIPITLLEQAGGNLANNPIQYYPDCHAEFNSAFLEANGSPTCYPFNEEFVRPQQHPVKPHKRVRKVKPPASVDPSEIKDIPASAQLWEFLLKVLKKPKYAYMVSWENQQDGLFRFHDPPAFAALWGRHRNRPSMTYDKVARALRYYYRRDILEQVGGRLTYKFSSRLCKQFASSIVGGSDKTNNKNSKSNIITPSSDNNKKN